MQSAYPFSTKKYTQGEHENSVKCKSIKHLEDNIGEILDDSRYGHDFQDTQQKHDPRKK